MIAALDVQYAEDSAVAAAVVFEEWSSPGALHTFVTEVTGVEPYQTGHLYRRELPCLLAVLRRFPESMRSALTAVIVDGHVWLENANSPGLGAHLYQTLDHDVPVIGVAKNPYRESIAVPVLRGESERPLYVTAVGLPAAEAAERVAKMHGDYRVPTLLKHVDSLARGTAT